MRRIVTHALVSATAVVGIAAGSLAGTGAAFAASPPTARTAVSADGVSALAVNNLGLSTAKAKNWQCFVRSEGFDPGTIDGKLGTDSWKATQRYFNDRGYNVGSKLVVDGIVGKNTIKALQNFLGVPVDGIAGPRTKGIFADFNTVEWCRA
ncbi:peptidoglycan-binding domain-containing protein [Streptomyces sp. NPDC041068]|uniref:peptidoglycan-binding domain-containing protein n=1 Tax=Streptomyces sp. NPDC041068 TaxID=3155130 RepID=UPI0033F7AD59